MITYYVYITKKNDLIYKKTKVSNFVKIDTCNSYEHRLLFKEMKLKLFKWVGGSMENKPNYYAIIPANVRYDKELSPNAKLLYGEITALCNEKGYCWANNSYFAELYSTSDRQIQRLIKNLIEKKYISVQLIDNKIRKIFIIDNHDKNVGVGMTKMSYYYDKNVTHNNKKNNKKNNNSQNLPSWIYEEVKSELMTEEELKNFEEELKLS